MSASRRCCPCGERVVSLLSVLLKDVLLKDDMGDGNKLFDMVAPDAGAPFALLAAAEAGDEPRVASLLQSQADVNAHDERVSHTALRGAALFGHAECIRLLVEAGAAVNQSSERGKTPLMGAAMNGHVEALELLLQHRRWVQSRAMARPKRLIGPGERL